MAEVLEKHLYEYEDARSNKFWEVSLLSLVTGPGSGYPRGRRTNSYAVDSRWGTRTRRNWQSEGGTTKRLKTFSSENAARRFMRDKIRGKTQKGYTQVSIPKKRKKIKTTKKPKAPTMEEASLLRFADLADEL